METRENIFKTLLFLSLISFVLFGSLSHIINLMLITLFFVQFIIEPKFNKFDRQSQKIFLALSAIFFIFLIRGFFYFEPWRSIHSLSPMSPIPILGLLILLQQESKLRICQASLARFSNISILTAFVFYCFSLIFLSPESKLAVHYISRLEFFSGNPIPFSFAVLGVSVFCLCNLENANWKEKLVAILCFIIGVYFSSLLSGTRSTLPSIVLAVPFIFWQTFRSLYKSIYFSVLLVLTLALLWYVGTVFSIELQFFNRIRDGFYTILRLGNADQSLNIRFTVWVASIETIKTVPFYGLDISNRFAAIVPHLPNDFGRIFTHPHTDIMASIIGAGPIAGIFTVVSLLSPIWAALLAKKDKKLRLFLALIIEINVIFTANFNTIFFNDITSAWLAFSTFLLWNFKSNDRSTKIRPQ